MKNDWEIKKLGEVCEINIGRTPERGNFKMWDKEKKTDNVWLSIADLNNTEKGYISDSTEYVSDNAVPKMKLVKANTLLMSFKLTIGRCAITKRDLFTNEAIAALPILDKNLDLFFLKYYLENFDWAKLTEGDVKVKGKTLNKEKLKEVPITLPPLEEQKRIVKILDEKLAMLETVKANAKANLQNAKDLFQSQLTKVFSNTTWEKKRLYEVCSITSKLVDPTLPEYLDLYHVGGANIESETGIIIDLQTSKEEGLSSGKFTFDDTMVLYNKIRPYLKKVARPDFNGLCSADMYPLSPKTNITKDYLYYILTSNDFTEYAISKSGRAGMPKVNREALFAYECYIPPLSEQKRIVEQLDSLSEKVRSLEEIYTKQLANCDELKQAFLAKAFNGEL